MSERYLTNENFPAEIIHHLRRRGDDVLYAAEEIVGASDIELLRKALADDRIVLSRLRQQPPDAILGFLRAFLDSNPSLRGMFTVSSPGQFRQIPLS
jgi:hypothetical protein